MRSSSCRPLLHLLLLSPPLTRDGGVPKGHQLQRLSPLPSSNGNGGRESLKARRRKVTRRRKLLFLPAQEEREGWKGRGLFWKKRESALVGFHQGRLLLLLHGRKNLSLRKAELQSNLQQCWGFFFSLTSPSAQIRSPSEKRTQRTESVLSSCRSPVGATVRP